MSVIDEALRKLEDERNQQARQDSGGAYMAAPRVEAPSTSNISRLLWMVLGGGVVAAVVLTWVGTGSQPTAPVATVAVVTPVQAVAAVARLPQWSLCRRLLSQRYPWWKQLPP